MLSYFTPALVLPQSSRLAEDDRKAKKYLYICNIKITVSCNVKRCSKISNNVSEETAASFFRVRTSILP
jgi:hypothetical protein